MTVVVDTSALVAVILGEPDAPQFAAVLADHAGEVCISAATLVECEIVLESRHGHAAVLELANLLTKASITVVDFDRPQGVLAAAAWRRFGKGRHSARLNLADCYSYALAQHLGARLLYKGDDFAQTDVRSAL